MHSPRNCWTECTLWRGETGKHLWKKKALANNNKKTSEYMKDLELDWRGGEWNKAVMETSIQKMEE